MRPSDKPEYDVLAQQPDEPIVLVGAPDEIEGDLLLHNPGEQKLIVRDARMRSERPKKARRGVPALPDFSLRRIVLRGGATRSVHFKIPISPHMPPGEYRGQFEVGGRTRDVVMHVTEMLLLDMSPSRVVVENRPRRTQKKRVVITNAGNVPLTIGEIGPVVLDDTLFACRTHRAAIAAVGDQVSKLDDYIAELARQVKATFERTGHLRVHLAQGELSLEPGEVRAVDLEVRVPDKLDRRARYTGTAALYNSNLEFLVVPTPTASTKRSTKAPS